MSMEAKGALFIWALIILFILIAAAHGSAPPDQGMYP